MSSGLHARDKKDGLFRRTRPRDVPISGHPDQFKAEAALTGSFQDARPWMRDNEFILSGYRQEQGNWSGCFRSVFGYLHNETVNIHTHLLGALLFVYLSLVFFYTIVTQHESATWKDTVVFAVYFFSAFFCLMCSAFYHMAVCHSQSVCARCHAFDYLGIVVLIVGSFIPCIYYVFLCRPVYRLFYISAISFAGAVTAYVILDPEYAKPSHRHARTNVFLALGFSGGIPMLHGLVAHGYQPCIEMGFASILVGTGFPYTLGALIYANRVPERFGPGRFDVIFASHQIFHVCVVVAALSHYNSLLTLFHHWHGTRGAASCMTTA